MKNREMSSSWLVQRLDPPTNFVNPFSFGGGGGQLSGKATDLLKSVWSFDYMGAAEFEFGAVPEALGRMANADLAAFTIDLPAGTVYVLCPAEWTDQVTQRLTDWSTTPPRMKESMRFDRALAGEEYIDTVGWLELDNGFLFFIDETMWQRAAAIFDVKVPVQ